MEIIVFGLFLWLFLAGAVAVWAHSKGGFAFGWFIISVMLSPLVGAICVALIKPKATPARDEMGQIIKPGDFVRCPICKEAVRHDALKCKHCGAVLQPG